MCATRVVKVSILDREYAFASQGEQADDHEPFPAPEIRKPAYERHEYRPGQGEACIHNPQRQPGSPHALGIQGHQRCYDTHAEHGRENDGK